MPNDTQALLAELGWLRELARGLVSDPALADDLAQETCVAALEHRPDPSRPLRGWLATVLRNTLRQSHRSGQRRSSREHAAAQPESLDAEHGSPVDALERVATQRAMTTAVLELEEPFRSAILMRFFQDLPPRRIAKRLNVPVSTVKSRLARGLALLRERLDVEPREGNRPFLALLALASEEVRPPLLASAASKSAAALGALAVSTNVKIALAAASLVAGVFLVQRARDAEPAQPETAAVLAATGGEAAALSTPSERAQPEAPADPVRAAIEVTESAPRGTANESAATNAAGSLTLRGHVIDLAGNSLADVDVHHWQGMEAADDNVVARTDVRGDFAWTTDAVAGQFGVRDEVWTTALSARASARVEPVVVAAPRIAAGGWVVNERGEWISGASVKFRLPENFRSRFAEILDQSMDVARRAATDAQGHFAFAELPLVEGAELEVHHDDYEPLVVPAPTATDVQMTLVLGQTDLAGLATVRGRVVDTGGDPVEGALVSLAFDTTRTDAAGEFELALDDEESFNKMARRFTEVVADTLVAVAEGALPARAHATLSADGALLWPPYVVLQLGASPLSIRGRVVDEVGEPRAGVMVWIGDPKFVGWQQGARGPSALKLESLLAGSDEPYLSVTTDGAGNFELPGLEDREYRVEAMDDLTLRRVVQRIPAGESGAVLALPTDDLYATLAGRVMTSDGEPVVGANVFPMCDTFLTTYRSQTISTRHSRAAGVVTDEDGRFALVDVPRDLVYLRIDGEDTIPLEWGRGHLGGLEDLTGGEVERVEIVVASRMHLQVELSGSDTLEMAIFDAGWNSIPINVFVGNGRRTTPRVELEPGPSPTMAFSDAAQTLVLYMDGVEVARHSLHLVRGEVNTLEL